MNFKLLAGATAIALAPVMASAASVDPIVTDLPSATTYNYGVLEGSLTAPGNDPDYVSSVDLVIETGRQYFFDFFVTGESGSLTQTFINEPTTRRGARGTAQFQIDTTTDAMYDLYYIVGDEETLVANVTDGAASTNFSFGVAANSEGALKWVWSGVAGESEEGANDGEVGQVSTNITVNEYQSQQVSC